MPYRVCVSIVKRTNIPTGDGVQTYEQDGEVCSNPRNTPQEAIDNLNQALKALPSCDSDVYVERVRRTRNVNTVETWVCPAQDKPTVEKLNFLQSLWSEIF